MNNRIIDYKYKINNVKIYVIVCYILFYIILLNYVYCIIMYVIYIIYNIYVIFIYSIYIGSNYIYLGSEKII